MALWSLGESLGNCVEDRGGGKRPHSVSHLVLGEPSLLQLHPYREVLRPTDAAKNLTSFGCRWKGGVAMLSQEHGGREG